MIDKIPDEQESLKLETMGDADIAQLPDGHLAYAKEDDCLFGRVMFIRPLLTYEGQTLAELKADFEGVVDEYLGDCKAGGRTPEKPFKGSFNVRVSSEVHRRLVLAAEKRHETLNKYVSDVLAESVGV